MAPVLAPLDPTRISLAAKLQAPSLMHWLGTDYFGRDVLSHAIWGGRVSLLVGLLVASFAFIVGVPLGPIGRLSLRIVALIAGFADGRPDNVLMRLTDAFLTFPPLLLTVAIAGRLGPDIQNVMLALGLVEAPVLARIVRGSTLSAREEVYVRVTSVKVVGISRPTEWASGGWRSEICAIAI